MGIIITSLTQHSIVLARNLFSTYIIFSHVVFITRNIAWPLNPTTRDFGRRKTSSAAIFSLSQKLHGVSRDESPYTYMAYFLPLCHYAVIYDVSDFEKIKFLINLVSYTPFLKEKEIWKLNVCVFFLPYFQILLVHSKSSRLWSTILWHQNKQNFICPKWGDMSYRRCEVEDKVIDSLTKFFKDSN